MITQTEGKLSFLHVGKWSTDIRRMFPDGTFTVGAGIVLAGLTSYGFLVISARALGPESYGALAALWALTFLVVPGFFGPIEQELGRVLAGRRAIGAGGGPAIRRATLVATCISVVLLFLTGILSSTLLSRIFDRHAFLLAGFAIALIGFGSSHLVKGTFSGSGSFNRYGILLAAEGLLRFLACAALAILGVKTPGFYGLAFGLTSLLAIGFAALTPSLFTIPGPQAPWGELSKAFGYLFIATLFSAFLVNGPALAVKLLATSEESTAAGRFLGGLIIARIPLFLFQSVQITLLPHLAVLAANGRHDEFRAGIRKVLAVVGIIGLMTTVTAITVGPSALRLFFGRDFTLERVDIAYLASASIFYIIALVFTYALIAQARHGAAALSWMTGSIIFLLMLIPHASLFFRVERALLAGSITAGVVAGWFLMSFRNDMSKQPDPNPNHSHFITVKARKPFRTS